MTRVPGKRSTVTASVVILSAVLVAIPSPWSSPGAMNLRATPHVSTAVGWDSNILSAVDNQVSDGVFQVYPGLTFSLDMLNTTINLSGSLGYEWYFSHKELNTYTRNGVFGLSVARPIEVTANLTLTPDARYFKQSDIYVRNASVLGSTGGVLPTQSYPMTSTTLTQSGAGLGAVYTTSGSSRIVFTGVWSKDDYSSPGLLDTEFFQGSLAYEKRFTERMHIGPFVSGNETRYSDGQVSKIYTGALSGNYRLTDAWRISIRGGASRWSLDDEDPVVIRESGTAPYANLDVNYAYGTWSGAFGGAYQTQGMGGVQSLVKSVSVYASLAKNLTELWNVALGGGYQRNISVTASNNINAYWHSMARIQYSMTPDLSFHLTGSHWNTNLREPGATDSTVTRDSVFIGFDARKQFTIF